MFLLFKGRKRSFLPSDFPLGDVYDSVEDLGSSDFKGRFGDEEFFKNPLNYEFFGDQFARIRIAHRSPSSPSPRSRRVCHIESLVFSTSLWIPS
jgi:hypothetical protein